MIATHQVHSFPTPPASDPVHAGHPATDNGSGPAALLHLLSMAPTFLLVLNDRRGIEFANDAFITAIGKTSAGQIEGKKFGDELRCENAESAPAGCGTGEACSSCGALRAIRESRILGESVQECHITRRGLNALELRVSARKVSVNDADYTLMAATDIGDEKRRRILEKVFFHDVINSAGAMTGILEVMKEEATSGSHQLLGTAYQAAHQLLDEIESQQFLMSAERGEIRVQKVPGEARDVLHRVRDMYASHLVAEGRSIVIGQTGDERVPLETDWTLLRRVIGNMTKNALEASHAGDAVTLSLTQDETHVHFSVHNPSFIPREVQHMLFQRSFSTKGENRGLGTYSMRLFTERYLGGRIAFRSSSVSGTVFTASIPRIVPNVAAPERDEYITALFQLWHGPGRNPTRTTANEARNAHEEVSVPPGEREMKEGSSSGTQEVLANCRDLYGSERLG